MSEGAGERAPGQDSVAGPPILCVGPDMAQRSPEDKVRWLGQFLDVRYQLPLALPNAVGDPGAAGWQRRAGRSQRDHGRAQKCRRRDGVLEVTERPIDAKPGASGAEESGSVTGGQQRSLEIEGDGLRASELQDLAARLVANRNEPGVGEVRIG
jgi:hypothetical protein